MVFWILATCMCIVSLLSPINDALVEDTCAVSLAKLMGFWKMVNNCVVKEQILNKTVRKTCI